MLGGGSLSDKNTSANLTVTNQGFSQGFPPSNNSGTSSPTSISIAQTPTAETVQIVSVTVSPTTINASTSPTSATITVMVNHSDSGNLQVASVDVYITTYTQSPSGNAVSYPLTFKNLSVKGSAGYVTKTFTVNSIPGTTVQGSIGIGAYLQNAQPSSVSIVAPNFASDAEAILYTTAN